MKKNKQVVKPGDVLAIPLPDGRFAFGRMFEDGVLGVYAKTGNTKDDAPIGFRLFAFQTGVYSDVVSSGVWPKVGKDKFHDPEADWPMPQFIGSLDDPSVEIYFRGKVTGKVSTSSVVGMNPVSASDAEHVIDRIVAIQSRNKSKWDLTPWQTDFIDLSDQKNPKRVPHQHFQ